MGCLQLPLISISCISQLLEEVGFIDVNAKDNTVRFIEVLKSERERFDREKATFLTVCLGVRFSFAEVVNVFSQKRGWTAKTAIHSSWQSLLKN